MKLYSNPFVLDILNSRDLSNLNNKPFALLHKVLNFKGIFIKLRRLAIKKFSHLIANYFSSKLETFKTARKLKENILELNELNDHILNDIGVSKEVIPLLVQSTKVKGDIKTESETPQNVHSLKNRVIKHQEVNNQKAIKTTEIVFRKCG